MNGNHATALLSGLAGFLLGGLLARGFLDLTAIVMTAITIGATLGAAIGALKDEDIAKFGAFGGGVGLLAGLLLAIVDIVWF